MVIGARSTNLKKTRGKRNFRKRYHGKKSISRMSKEINVLKHAVMDNWDYLGLTASQTPSYGGAFIAINQLAGEDAGGGQDTGMRSGNIVIARSLELNFLLQCGFAAGTYYPSITRILVFWDKQNISTSAADILATTGSVYAPISRYKTDNREKFEILYDKTFATSGNIPERVERVFLNLHDKVMKYSDETATSYVQNKLMLVIISDTNTNYPNVYYSGKLKYLG